MNDIHAVGTNVGGQAVFGVIGHGHGFVQRVEGAHASDGGEVLLAVDAHAVSDVGQQRRLPEPTAQRMRFATGQQARALFDGIGNPCGRHVQRSLVHQRTDLVARVMPRADAQAAHGLGEAL